MYVNGFRILFSLYFHKPSKAFKTVSVITVLKRLNRKSFKHFFKKDMPSCLNSEITYSDSSVLFLEDQVLKYMNL